jgi:hypothetical protein
VIRIRYPLTVLWPTFTPTYPTSSQAPSVITQCVPQSSRLVHVPLLVRLVRLLAASALLGDLHVGGQSMPLAELPAPRFSTVKRGSARSPKPSNCACNATQPAEDRHMYLAVSPPPHQPAAPDVHVPQTVHMYHIRYTSGTAQHSTVLHATAGMRCRHGMAWRRRIACHERRRPTCTWPLTPAKLLACIACLSSVPFRRCECGSVPAGDIAL